MKCDSCNLNRCTDCLRVADDPWGDRVMCDCGCDVEETMEQKTDEKYHEPLKFPAYDGVKHIRCLEAGCNCKCETCAFVECRWCGGSGKVTR